jgi:hypothetical protein
VCGHVASRVCGELVFAGQEPKKVNGRLAEAVACMRRRAQSQIAIEPRGNSRVKLGLPLLLGGPQREQSERVVYPVSPPPGIITL